MKSREGVKEPVSSENKLWGVPLAQKQSPKARLFLKMKSHVSRILGSAHGFQQPPSHYSRGCKPHFHQQTMPLCACCVAVPTRWLSKRNATCLKAKEKYSWWRASVTFNIWLISGSRDRRGEQDSLPSFSPMARETFDVVAHGMLLFIPLCNKSHMFYFLRRGFCYFKLWRSTARYVTCDTNGTNADRQNARMFCY